MTKGSSSFIPATRSEPRALSRKDLQDVYEEVRDQLLRVLWRRTGDRELAADLAQEVFIKLSNVHTEILDSRHGRAYLFRMAGNLAIDHQRSEARHVEILTGSQVLFEDTQQGPDDIAVSRDEIRLIRLALDGLPELCRNVFLLSQVDGLRHKEIAARLGVSVSLVEKYKLRALRHCRDAIDRR